MINEYRHTPVMLTECIEQLHIKPSGIYVDATLGGAGHAIEVAKRLNGEGILVGIDQDNTALIAASELLNTLPNKNLPRIELLHGNFGDLDELLLSVEIPGIDGILFDLGVSSPQLNWQARGFSFRGDGLLDMRMDPSKQTKTAAEIINTYNEADLARIIRIYSDEKWSARIAKFIVRERETAEITHASQLVDIIKEAIPAKARRRGGHPAKRTFQALRIEVNSELTVLEQGLESAVRWLNPNGSLVVISYHSIEDRIVKESFKKCENRCTCPVDLPVCVCGKEPLVDIVTHKPLVPTRKEVARNPRSRSAKLRVSRKL